MEAQPGQTNVPSARAAVDGGLQMWLGQSGHLHHAQVVPAGSLHHLQRTSFAFGPKLFMGGLLAWESLPTVDSASSAPQLPPSIVKYATSSLPLPTAIDAGQNF